MAEDIPQIPDVGREENPQIPVVNTEGAPELGTEETPGRTRSRSRSRSRTRSRSPLGDRPGGNGDQPQGQQGRHLSLGHDDSL